MKSFREFISDDWNDKDNKKLKKKDGDFVSCEERYTTEKDEFAEYEKKYGKSKVDECCKKVKPPRKREKFEQCLKGK